MNRQMYNPFEIVGQINDKLKVQTTWHHADGTILCVYIWYSQQDGQWKASDLACTMQEYHSRYGEPPEDRHFEIVTTTCHPGAEITIQQGCIVALSDNAMTSIYAVSKAVVRFNTVEDIPE